MLNGVRLNRCVLTWIVTSVFGAPLASPTATAAPIQFQFAGQLDNVTGNFAGTAWSGVLVGDPFTVAFTFESTTADALLADTTRGVYAQTINAFSVQIGAASDSGLMFNGSINVYNDHATEHDYFHASGFLSNNVTATVEFRDAARAAFNSDALPASLDPGSFPFRQFSLTVPAGGTIRGTIDLPVVPEPNAITLILAACAIAWLPFRPWRVLVEAS